MEDKVYTTLGSKVLDFLIGFMLIGTLFSLVMNVAMKMMHYTHPAEGMAVTAIALVALSKYLYKKRRYMGIGLFSVLVLQAVAVLPFLLMLALQK